MKRIACACALAVSAMVARASEAQAAPQPQPPQPEAAPSPKRAMPDYDGRGGPKTTVGDVALWVPRVIFSPLYFVSEFVLRRPFGWLITTAERDKWPSAIADFFTFDKERTSGLVPTAFVDFGFLPSVGLYFFWDDAVVKGNDVRLHGATWGEDWLSIGVLDRVRLSPTSNVAFHADWSRRQDYVFHGIGARTREANRARYSSDRLDVGPGWDLRVTKTIHLKTAVGLRAAQFREGSCCRDPSVEEYVREGRLELPPGYTNGFTAGYEKLEVAVDSRLAKGSPSGVSIAAEAEHATDVRVSNAASWVRYGATAGAYTDVTGHERVVGLTVTAQFADPIHGSEIPFTEQVVNSGFGALRGFRPGRLVGRSALAATLQYDWPIWVWLKGSMHIAAGNVFDAGLRDFAPKLLRLSSGIGLSTSSSPDHRFEMLFGIGTETFDQGAKISSFRLVVGATKGF